MIQLIIQPQAAHEAGEAARWYEEQHPGLGIEFLLELDAALDRVLDHSDIYPPMYGEARRVLVRRFPYAAYFVVEPDTVQVIAVLHQRRNPDIMQSRLPS